MLAQETKARFRGLSPFGVEITGLNIETVDREFLDGLKRSLASSGFAIIRDQPISDAKFVTFLQGLGSLTFTVGEKPVEHQPLLNVVSNVGRSRPAKSVFHTDTSYIAKPPAYTALKAITLPESGGETLFCDQYRAYETLPKRVQQKLANAKVLHVVSGLTLNEKEESETWQPLFRKHPISGRIALYLSTPERCKTITGINASDSERAIRLLYKHSIRSARTYRHGWKPGDVVIWDNRCTMHRADHSRVVGDRVLHRGLILGEVPLAIA